MNTPVRVLFVVMPNSLALDWAGPAEALRIANDTLVARGAAPAFQVGFIGPEAEPSTSVGISLKGVAALPPIQSFGEQPTWVILLGQPGQRLDPHTPAMGQLLDWLRGFHAVPGQRELLCVCAGSLIAAHAGLLDHHEATTHHQHLQELRTVAPRCHAVGNRVFVESDGIWSSAGITTGIDLMLCRIADICGEPIAARVAETMVVALRRGPADPERSPFLTHRSHLHPLLHKLQDAIAEDPRAAWTLESMARMACVTPRHLSRLFLQHADLTPLEYLQRIRLSTAEAALRVGARVGQAADIAGFSSEVQLRRAWARLGQHQTPPSEFRKRHAKETA
jgi:transcriptional regulator GlxA family with amidase domain